MVAVLGVTRRKIRCTARDIVVDMLANWGRWEAEDRYEQWAQRSSLGRFIREGGNGPRSAAPPLPPHWIPGDVAEVSRMLAQMRAECRAGERYYQEIRRRYVKGERISGDVIERAEKTVVSIWLNS